MANQKNNAETKEILFENIAEILQDYQQGETLLLIKIGDTSEDNIQTRVASGIIAEHIPAVKRIFERMIEESVENVAAASPIHAAQLMARMMMDEMEKRAKAAACTCGECDNDDE